MRSIEHDIAATLTAFLSARGDRIACDQGTLVLHDDHGVLVARLEGVAYTVTILVAPASP